MGIDPNERSRGGVSVRINTDTHKAIGLVDGLVEVLKCDKSTMEYGAILMERDINYAFSAKVDPTTGAPWAPRKHSYPWPMLQRSGNLRQVISTGWGLKTKNGKPRFFGRVNDGLYVGMPGESRTYTRGGDADRKPNIVVAGATMFGRSKARTSRGGKLKWTTPATGGTPGRMFIGFSKSSEQKLAHEIKTRITEVASRWFG